MSAATNLVSESRPLAEVVDGLFSLVLDHPRAHESAAAIDASAEEFDSIMDELHGAADATRRLLAEADALLASLS